MTSNQIAYATHLEKVRSDLANEELKRKEQELSKQELSVKAKEAEIKHYSAQETARANRAQEELSRSSIEANVLNNIRSTDATIYAASTGYAATRYSADVSRANTTDTLAAESALRQAKVQTEKTQQWKMGADTVLNAVTNVINTGLKIATFLA